MFGRRKIAALVAEFLGTGILTLLILSVQRSTIGVPYFVAIAAGLTVTVVTFAVGNVSGAHLNPAVTLGMWTARRAATLTSVLYIAVQFLGAWLAYYLYTYFVNNSLQPIGGKYSARVLVAEAVGAAIFALGFAAAAQYRRVSNATAAAMSGLAFTVGIIAASAVSIGLVNPAVALGVRSFVWNTYLLGPVLGAVIGVNLYTLLFAPAEAIVEAENAVVGARAGRGAVVAPASTSQAVATPARKPRAAAKTTRKTTAKRTTAKRRTTRK